MTGSFQFSLLFSCMKGIYILLLNKAYSQLTLGYSRTTALILVTAPILFIYSVECHRGVAPVPPQTFVYKSLTKNFCSPTMQKYWLQHKKTGKSKRICPFCLIKVVLRSRCSGRCWILCPPDGMPVAVPARWW